MPSTKPADVKQWVIQVKPDDSALFFPWQAHIYGYLHPQRRESEPYVYDYVDGFRTAEKARKKAEQKICDLVAAAKHHRAQIQVFSFEVEEC